MTNDATRQAAGEGQLDFSRNSDFDLATLSPEVAELSRKNIRIFLQQISNETAVAIAERIGVHESQISRFKQGPLAYSAMVLAAAGLKVVPADTVVFIKPDEFN